MKVIGITGGIGSGKSLVCRFFSMLGIPVYDADAAARMLMEGDEELRKKIKGELGPDAYLPNGSLNRAWIAGIVFSDPLRLEQLNELVHPAVTAHFQQWKSKQQSPYVLREAAILLESGTYHDLDGIILVDAPEALRLQRVKDRDGRTEEEIRKIISRQWTSEEKRKYANFVVQNDSNTLLLPQLLSIHRVITTSKT